MSELRTLFATYWEQVLHDHPMMATQLGDRRFENRLNDYSAHAFEQELAFEKATLASAKEIDSSQLSERDRMEQAVFVAMLESSVEATSFAGHLIPLTQLFGPHLDLLQLSSLHPTGDRAGLESLVERLQAFPRQVQQLIARMREGVAKGMVGAQVNFSAIAAQVEAAARGEGGVPELLAAFDRAPATIPGKAELRARASSALDQGVIPAYGKLAEFLRHEYLPKCRTTEGLLSLPNGDAYYAHLVRHHTTIDIDPAEVHRIGQDEVERIHGEMARLKEQLGFSGSIQEFAASLRHRPELYCTTEDDVLTGFREVLAEVKGRLPELFGRLPQQDFEVRPVEPFRAANAPDAFYMPPAGDRPGIFYANTHRPTTRPRYTMEALAYHEAVPGHHFQIALAQEIEDLPDFRKHGMFTAYVEGWALYSERLPKEIGFYQDIYSEFGRLTLELWRAARLVVDTGIHQKGWSREQGIEYMTQGTALSAENVAAEVERYICMGGQALSYKIGELSITRMRRDAEAALNNFDLRSFHDRLLGIGAVPLGVLEHWLREWIERQKVGNGRA
jgi:uncharacterized protein (DUF885 family)